MSSAYELLLGGDDEDDELSPPQEENNMSDNRSNYSRWIKKGEGTFMPSDNVQVVDRIEAGAYNVTYSHRDEVFKVTKIDVKTDGLVDIPQPETIEVMNAVDEFYSQQEQFKEWDFVFKRGFLLYGIPGGGKTSIISAIMKYVTEQKDGIAFVIYDLEDLEYYSRFMKTVYRDIEPNRLVLAIFEDIDGMVKNETLLINTLDGLGNSNNILNIATTNYTERLSERIINRPNRFDRRFEIKSPNEEARKFYLEQKIKPDFLKNIKVDEWVEETDGLTIAQLSELIKSVCILGQPFFETIEILKGLKKIPDSSQYNKKGGSNLGFQSGQQSKVVKLEAAEEDNELGIKFVTYKQIPGRGMVQYEFTEEEFIYYQKFGTLLDTVHERESKKSASASKKD